MTEILPALHWKQNFLRLKAVIPQILPNISGPISEFLILNLGKVDYHIGLLIARRISLLQAKVLFLQLADLIRQLMDFPPSIQCRVWWLTSYTSATCSDKSHVTDCLINICIPVSAPTLYVQIQGSLIWNLSAWQNKSTSLFCSNIREDPATSYMVSDVLFLISQVRFWYDGKLHTPSVMFPLEQWVPGSGYSLRLLSPRDTGRLNIQLLLGSAQTN